MGGNTRSYTIIERENEVLRQRISEARASLDAIKECCLQPLLRETNDAGEKTTADDGTAVPFQLLIETMPFGAALVSQEGEILYANSGLIDMAAMGSGLRGLSIFDLVSTQDRSALADLFQVAEHGNAHAVVSFRRGNEGVFPASVTLRSGQNDQGALCFTITELSNQEQYPLIMTPLAGTDVDTFGGEAWVDAERDSTPDQIQRFRVLVDAAPAMLWVSTVDGQCTFLSRGWYEFTGQNEMSGLGLGRLSAVHYAHSMEVEKAYFRSHVRREPFEIQYRLKCSDGNHRWVNECGRPRFAESGEFLGFIGAVVDIDSQKQTEHRILKNNSDLEHRVNQCTTQLRALAVELGQTKQRERKRLARELHDNIQQLLVAVKIQARLAQPAEESPGPIREVIRLTDETILACRSIVVGLSPPGLTEAGLMENLNTLAQWFHEQHEFDISVSCDDVPRQISRQTSILLYESARELLFNVVKHAGVNHARVRYWQGEVMAAIDVMDEGIGCDNSVLEKPGTQRFGLFSIRERLAAYGGGLAIKAKPGRGTHARAFVPLTVPEETPFPLPNRSPEALPRPERSPRALRVLLADDHQILRQGLAKLLGSQADLEVVAEASDGIEAIELAQKLNPDVVIMDISMPNMGGIEATSKILAAVPEIRVVGLSMHESEELARAMRNAGAEAYVTKSGPIEELLAALRG